MMLYEWEKDKLFVTVDFSEQWLFDRLATPQDTSSTVRKATLRMDLDDFGCDQV